MTTATVRVSSVHSLECCVGICSNDATELMQLADEGGVKYDVRSIGSVPQRGLQWRAERALATEGPMSPMDLACWLSIGTHHDAVSWRQVHGAMLRPMKEGRVRLLRGKLVLV